MNDDASEWAAVLILLVWAWCLLAVVPAFFARHLPRVERVLHASGVVAVALFVAFWVSLLEGDSDLVGYLVVPLSVVALGAWTTRRYAVAALAFWVAAAVLAVGDAAFMVFYGPAPLGVVSGAIALSAAAGTEQPAP